MPASAGEVGEAISYLITAVEPDASDDRVEFMSRLISQRGYSRAELVLVMQELPFDHQAAHNYGRGFNPADAERIVSASREKRTRLSGRLTDTEVQDLLIEHKDLRREDFHRVGYTHRQESLFRYTPNVKKAA